MTPVIAAIALLALGVALILWALYNPKWQHAEAYDQMGPFIAGCCLVVVGLLILLGLFLVSLSEGALP